MRLRMNVIDSGEAAADPFDLDALERVTGGDCALMMSLVTLWASQGPALLASVEASAAPAAWLAALHDLRSAAGTVGAGEVVRLCLAAERTATLPGARTCILRELETAVAASAACATAALGEPEATALRG